MSGLEEVEVDAGPQATFTLPVRCAFYGILDLLKDHHTFDVLKYLVLVAPFTGLLREVDSLSREIMVVGVKRGDLGTLQYDSIQTAFILSSFKIPSSTRLPLFPLLPRLPDSL
jgi:hypothetical protein